jgi:CRP/FNR family transcriptional regulator, nitrogen fixation regulation protein
MLTSLSNFADAGFSTIRTAPSGMHRTVQPFSDRREGGGSAHGGQVLHFAPDAEIYGDGDENASFYKVLSGVVRTCKFRSDGRRQIDAFHLPGEIFGFDAGARHRLSAEAVSDCVVAAYRWRAVEAPGEIDDRLAAQFFGYAMRNLQRAQEHSLLLGCRSASQKVAAFLVEMGDRAACDHIIDLAMARQDIADYLGLTIETVSRTMTRLVSDRAIGLPTTRHIVLRNRSALRDLNS